MFALFEGSSRKVGRSVITAVMILWKKKKKIFWGFLSRTSDTLNYHDNFDGKMESFVILFVSRRIEDFREFKDISQKE